MCQHAGCRLTFSPSEAVMWGPALPTAYGSAAHGRFARLYFCLSTHPFGIMRPDWKLRTWCTGSTFTDVWIDQYATREQAYANCHPGDSVIRITEFTVVRSLSRVVLLTMVFIALLVLLLRCGA